MSAFHCRHWSFGGWVRQEARQSFFFGFAYLLMRIWKSKQTIRNNASGHVPCEMFGRVSSSVRQTPLLHQISWPDLYIAYVLSLLGHHDFALCVSLPILGNCDPASLLL